MKSIILLLALVFSSTAFAERYTVVKIVSDEEQTVHVIYYDPVEKRLSLVYETVVEETDDKKITKKFIEEVYYIPNLDYTVLGEVWDFYNDTKKPILKRGPR